MRQLFSVFFILFFLGDVSAQYSRRLQPLYETEGGYYHPRGLHFAPGISYMLPAIWSEDIERSISPDTLQNGELSQRGKIGLYLEVGHAHFLPDWMWIEYIDYGLGFKMLRGRENFKGQLQDANDLSVLAEFDQEASYSESYVNAYLNFGKFIQTRDYQFIYAAIGVNADYRVLSSLSEDAPLFFNSQKPEDLQVQAHVKLGYGFKLQENLFFIPAIETPILNAVPFEDGKSTLPYYELRDRPILLTLRFQWLTRKKPEDCVGKPDKPTGHQLWDPKMRRKKKR